MEMIKQRHLALEELCRFFCPDLTGNGGSFYFEYIYIYILYTVGTFLLKAVITVA